MLGTHAVKVKFEGRNVWDFVGTGGSTTRLRIHALTMTPENAERMAAAQREHASEYGVTDVKVVEL